MQTGNVELVKLLYQRDPLAASVPAAHNAPGEFATRCAYTLAELKSNKKELLAVLGASTRDIETEDVDRTYEPCVALLLT